MGLFDLLRRGGRKSEVTATRSALEEARDPQAESGGAVTKLIQNILAAGLDGVGPYASATKVADSARKHSGSDVEGAIKRVVSQHVRSGAAGGFVTGLGGFATMVVAIPVNVFEFYVQATRMVGAIATLRGYDVTRPDIRTAVLLTLVGQDSQKVLASTGIPLGATSGRVTALALGNLPKSALMVINKAVGFRVLRSVGEKSLSRFGRLVPVAGGVLGGALDGFLMRRIADAARKEFPPLTTISGTAG
ncbi:EcsC family protein [Naumannella sp. ID2617S]|uniref:EcsC family protein n=1 Tax=Enemella dayhoffiae TaxID=2016507 RepID=A0A255HCD8_9ACTN|nr:EcsC family protein [Enemella dayhoffiae]NNG19810.1 EcsC family protein [Naumannella sp. ID2617S]OYO25062.1 hypothetical protein CGZ93_00935 [Enemella dayhoffiae]